jgi:benzoate membrane transport protein
MMAGLTESVLSAARSIRSDVSLSAIIVGVIAIAVVYAGPVLLLFQAAKVANLPNEDLSSWIWAVSVASGLTCIILSIRFKAPVIIAWSTPGAVLLIAGWSAYSYSEAIGAFVFSGAVTAILGFSGLFSAFMKRIPYSIITAMLAGILLKFGVDVFVALNKLPVFVLPMLLCYLVAKRLIPRYAVVATLLLGLGAAYGLGNLNFQGVSVALADPVFTGPVFSVNALLGLGIPLCIVTMASQNAAGIGVLRADGYDVPVNPLISATGIASVIFALFGAHGICLSSITAAICTGREAHADSGRRYIAGIACGVLYIVCGVLGATIVSVFSVFPAELIAVITGVALFGSISSSLTAAMKEEAQKESALITFLVTISGISIAGVGAPFWGLIAGIATNFILTGNIAKLVQGQNLGK